MKQVWQISTAQHALPHQRLTWRQLEADGQRGSVHQLDVSKAQGAARSNKNQRQRLLCKASQIAVAGGTLRTQMHPAGNASAPIRFLTIERNKTTAAGAVFPPYAVSSNADVLSALPPHLDCLCQAAPVGCRCLGTQKQSPLAHPPAGAQRGTGRSRPRLHVVCLQANINIHSYANKYATLQIKFTTENTLPTWRSM